VVTERRDGAFELLERGHERLRDVAPPELSIDTPASMRVGLDEPGVHGGWANREVRPVEPGFPCPLDEHRDPEWILARAPAGRSCRLHPRSDVHAEDMDRS